MDSYIIKNISGSPVPLVDFNNTKLGPGEEIDLGKFSQKERDESSDLQNKFSQGLLVCIRQTGSAIKRTLERQSGDGRLRPIRSTPLKPRPTPSSLRRQGMPEPAQPRYDNADFKEYFENMKDKYSVGNEEDEEVISDYDDEDEELAPEPTFVKTITTEEQRQQEIFINHRREVVIKRQILPPGTILSGELVDDPDEETFIDTVEPATVRKHITELFGKKCTGFTKNGKVCRKEAIVGFDYCLHHLPEDQKHDYFHSKK